MRTNDFLAGEKILSIAICQNSIISIAYKSSIRGHDKKKKNAVVREMAMRKTLDCSLLMKLEINKAEFLDSHLFLKRDNIK